MDMLLMEKLHRYIAENNVDLLLQLQKGQSMTQYLKDKVQNIRPFIDGLVAEGKPQYIIEELSMEALTRELRPSKYNYVKEILETEFEENYKRYLEIGVLTYELVNILEACFQAFELIPLTDENEDDRQLRYLITGVTAEYLGK
jgi:hypothetical protein